MPSRTFLFVLLTAAVASAQTSPSLMIRPWPSFDTGGPAVEVSQDAMVMPHVEGSTGYDAATSLYETSARWRIDPSAEHSIALGFQQTIIDGGSAPRIDLRNRVEQSMAVGVPLGETDDGWQFALTAGFGYAGNNAYGDGDAWHGLGSLIASKKLDESASLQLLLDYNGNRALWPDVPLPAILYNHRISDTLRYTAGLPFSSITWKPLDKLTVRGTYALPTAFSANVTYALLDQLELYGDYSRRQYVFHDNNLAHHDRVFFHHQRVESGLRWKACANFEAVVAGGWAFGQDYERGYDVTDLDVGVELDDAGYFRLGVDIRF